MVDSDAGFDLRLRIAPAGDLDLRDRTSLWISDTGRVDMAGSCSRSGTLRAVLVWHARAKVLPIPHRDRLNSSGPTSRCRSLLSRLVGHLAKLPTDLPSRARALIDLTPIMLSDKATATGLHGGDALVITHSRSASILRCVNTRLMLRAKQLGPGVRINSRS